jgi:hypothetical protein
MLQSDVLFNVRNHHVKLEADFVNTVISILLLEGIGRRLDPEMDLFKSAVPIMRQLGKQMSTTDIMQSGVDARGLGAMLKVGHIAARSRMGTDESGCTDLGVDRGEADGYHGDGGSRRHGSLRSVSPPLVSPNLELTIV